jgi:cytochrome c oxidase subunit 2
MTMRRACVFSSFVLLALAACVGEPVTTDGGGVKGLYDLFARVAAIVFVVVAGLIGWSIVRYRRRAGDEVLPEQFHTNTKLEILWFAIPQVIVIGLFVATAFVLDDVDARSENADLTVGVEAFQWGWRFSYEGGTVPGAGDVIVESLPSQQAEILLPVGAIVAFELISHDVVHSFYVPEFLVKRDVVPGRTNHLEVEITELGDYRIRCAEFCGLLHDRMDVTLRAVPAADFDTWLRGLQVEGTEP